MLDHFSRSELACPTTDELRLATGFGEALERLRVELDEPVYLSYACEAGCYSFWKGTTYFSCIPGWSFPSVKSHPNGVAALPSGTAALSQDGWPCYAEASA